MPKNAPPGGPGSVRAASIQSWRNFRHENLAIHLSPRYIARMKLKNPFLTAGYAGEDTFCDRRDETARMLAAFENDRNLTLIAPRRYGKTGLLRHVLARLPSDFTGIYLDIFPMEDLAAFSSAFAAAVVGALDSPVARTLSDVARFFKSCRPTVTPQEDGTPRFSFDIAPSAAKDSLDDAFAYLKAKQRRAVIAIDEFQQITAFPEQGVEALLRSRIQFVPWVRFVFAGSRHHVMSEMFGSAKRPFYQATEILSLGPIPPDEYEAFARRHFAARRQDLDADSFRTLLRRRRNSRKGYLRTAVRRSGASAIPVAASPILFNSARTAGRSSTVCSVQKASSAWRRVVFFKTVRFMMPLPCPRPA